MHKHIFHLSYIFHLIPFIALNVGLCVSESVSMAFRHALTYWRVLERQTQTDDRRGRVGYSCFMLIRKLLSARDYGEREPFLGSPADCSPIKTPSLHRKTHPIVDGGKKNPYFLYNLITKKSAAYNYRSSNKCLRPSWNNRLGGKKTLPE